MTKYRKKPVEIDAVQWDGSEMAADAIVGQIQEKGGDAFYERVAVSGSRFNDQWDPRIVIVTLEGPMVASPRDWIIRGIQGEHYPCKPDIFEATYEPVTR